MNKQHLKEMYLAKAASLLSQHAYDKLDESKTQVIIHNLQQLGYDHITDKCHLTLEVMDFIYTIEKKHLFYHLDFPLLSVKDKVDKLLSNINDYIMEYDYWLLMIRLSALSKQDHPDIYLYCHYYFTAWIDAFNQLLLQQYFDSQQVRQIATHSVLTMLSLDLYDRDEMELIDVLKARFQAFKCQS